MHEEHLESSSDIIPEPVPYEHGDHCIFYALQAANVHFNRRGLTIEDRSRVKKKADRLSHLYRAITGREEELGASLKLSLNFMLPRLEQLGIEPTNFVCLGETKGLIDQLRVVKKTDAKFKLGGNATFSLPALLFIDRADGTHTWFCPDKESWESEKQRHIKEESDNIVLILPLERKVKAPKT
jgi:hypothetical protein